MNLGRIELRRLRAIGWEEWDPVGIRSLGLESSAAAAYDEYLLHVAHMLAAGASPDEAVAFLDMIASEHMQAEPASNEASIRTVEAVTVYLESLR